MTSNKIIERIEQMIAEINHKELTDPPTEMLKAFRFMERRILMNLREWIVNESKLEKNGTS